MYEWLPDLFRVGLVDLGNELSCCYDISAKSTIVTYFS